MTIIETSGLRKVFKTRRGIVEAVQSIDMQVEEGEIFGFLGPNGAGKTTTMRMLTTLLEPSGGQVTVAGYNLRTNPTHVRKHIGYVSQSGGADRSATSRENLMLQAGLYGLSKAEARTRTAYLLSLLELEPFADRVVSTYSGGQRRRLDLALGMIHRPKLLFLDEPTAGLDPQSRTYIWDEIRTLRDGGMTIFLTTHYLDEADALCDRVAIIDGGRIVAEGTPNALKRQIGNDVVTLGLETSTEQYQQAQQLLQAMPCVREVQADKQGTLRLYVERGEEALPPIMHVLDDANLHILTITLARPTLDDVFLQLTGRSLRETTN